MSPRQLTSSSRQRVRFGLLVGLALFLLGLSPTRPALAQGGSQQAGIVVVHGDGRVITRCVAFEEPEITGAALLERSGLAMLTSVGPLGQTVCSLDGEGCPTTSCFCECMGTPCVYWVYHNQQPDGTWAYANLGAAQRTITQGDVDAWVWGEATQSPPAVSFDAICGAAPPAPVPTATPESASPTVVPVTPTPPPATDTPLPTASPEPTETAMEASPSPAFTPTPSPTPTTGPDVTPTSTSPPAATEVPEDAGDDLIPSEQEVIPSPSDAEGDGELQLWAFAAVLGTVVVAFFLLSRRSGA